MRQTRQNTRINATQGMAEEQFAAIAAAARTEALNAIEDLLTDDESVDYSTPVTQTLTQAQVHQAKPQLSDSDDTNHSSSGPDSVTDSSLETSSIEIIQPQQEGLEICLPLSPPPRTPPVPPLSPQSPRTNIVADVSGLISEDEDTTQVVPTTVNADPPEPTGRKEILSPTPQVSNSVLSAIELTVKDLEPSEQHLCDKCGEVDFQLSTHTDWNQPHPGLRNNLSELIPVLFETGFNTEGFPNLEKYLCETVGSLPYQPLIRLALDAIFEEFPEISAVQTKVYRMLKCHLSVIHHPSVSQFQDIDLSNHDFDRVVGTDFHRVSEPESRPDLSIHTDFNDTFYSVYSQAQRQAHRVIDRSFQPLDK